MLDSESLTELVALESVAVSVAVAPTSSSLDVTSLVQAATMSEQVRTELHDVLRMDALEPSSPEFVHRSFLLRHQPLADSDLDANP